MVAILWACDGAKEARDVEREGGAESSPVGDSEVGGDDSSPVAETGESGTSPPPPVPDADGDGWADTQDCAPEDPAVTTSWSLVAPGYAWVPLAASPTLVLAAGGRIIAIEGSAWEILGRSGDWTWAVESAGSLDTAPSLAATGDVDGDGVVDLVTATGGDVTVYPGDGAGGLGPGETWTPDCGDVTALVPVDLDGDGADEVVGRCASPALFVGTGVVRSFDDAAGAALVAADLDGDGDADLAVGHPVSATIELLWNDGTGAFTIASYATTEPRHLAAGDYDGDGDTDVATKTEDASFAEWLRNGGDGTFEALELCDHSEWVNPPQVFATVETSGDGMADLFVGAVYASGSVWASVALGSPEGAKVLADFAQPDGENVTGHTPADLDADGITDLVTWGEGGLQVARGGEDAFARASILPESSRVGIDGVGVWRQESSSAIRRYAWTGDGYAEDAEIATASWVSLALGDMDGDGVADLVTGWDSGDDYSLAVLRLASDGSVTSSEAWGGFPAAWTDLALADLDADGDLDALGSGSIDRVRWMYTALNDGDGTLELAAAIEHPWVADGYWHTWDVGELTGGRGAPDLAFAIHADGVVLAAGRGDGSFTTLWSDAEESGPDDISLGDIDRDGLDDVAWADDEGIQVRLNEGDGSSFVATIPSAETDVEDLQLADVTGDGRADLVVERATSWALLVSDGLGGFVETAGADLPWEAGDLHVFDADGDGRLDVAVNGGGLQLFLAACEP